MVTSASFTPNTAARHGGITLGRYAPPHEQHDMTLSRRDVQQHMHIIGTSGSGKSRFLAALFLLLVKAGLAVSLIDPHGDLADLIQALLAATGFYTDASAFERVRILDIPAASRAGLYLPFNVLAQPYGVHATARHLVEVCKRAWSSLAHGSAPLLETIMLHSSVVLAENGRPLTEMTRLLTDRAYRDQLLTRVSDPAMVQFFHDRYDHWGRNPATLIESTLRRVSLLTFSPILRHSLGQGENLLPFRAFLDQGISVVYNLGGLDEETQRFLGCLITVGYEVAALDRASTPTRERRPHLLILDEYAMFAATSEEALSRMLSLTRKYGLFLALAHQTWSQASTRLQGALQNVGWEVVFRLGRRDAEHAAYILGRIDPYAIKHDAEPGVRAQPVYYSTAEQRLAWEQAITALAPRQAFIRRPTGTVAKIRTIGVPDVAVDARLLASIQAAYLRRYFRAPAASVSDTVPEPVPGVSGPPLTTRLRRLSDEDEE